MNKKYLLLLLTIITISSVGITHAVNPVQEDKKKTGVLFNVQNMNFITSNGSVDLDFPGSGSIFFSERLVLNNGLADQIGLSGIGYGKIAGGETDGNAFTVSTLFISKIFGPIEFTFHGTCDYSGPIDLPNPEIVITWKQVANDFPQIIDIKPSVTSSFNSICQTP